MTAELPSTTGTDVDSLGPTDWKLTAVLDLSASDADALAASLKPMPGARLAWTPAEETWLTAPVRAALDSATVYDAAPLGKSPLRMGSIARLKDSNTADRLQTSPKEIDVRRKLRILCLHGYHGSAKILRGQLAALATSIEPLADLVFIDAPSLAAGDFGWWHAVANESDPSHDDPGVDGPRRHYQGWERTRAAIIAAFDALGPFDGVLGFSQGAALAGLLVGLRAPGGRATPERPLRFDFALMIGGFASRDPGLARLYSRPDSYDLPSLHLFGRSDAIVSMSASRALAERFHRPTLVEHAGGHVIANEPGVRDPVRAFLEERSARSEPSPV